MYDHIGLQVKDMESSTRFYTAILRPLGAMLTSSDVSYAGFGPSKDQSMLWLHLTTSKPVGGTHVAFQAASRSDVDRFHRVGLQAGGRDNGAPGVRADYGPNYYAAFLLDPDGHNVEAVCLK